MVQKVVGSIPISHPRFTSCELVSNRSVPRGKRFDPDIPPQEQASEDKIHFVFRAVTQGKLAPARLPHVKRPAGIVQWLVCKFSKLEMRVQFSLPAPDKKDNKSLLLLYFLSPVRENAKRLPAPVSKKKKACFLFLRTPVRENAKRLPAPEFFDKDAFLL